MIRVSLERRDGRSYDWIAITARIDERDGVPSLLSICEADGNMFAIEIKHGDKIYIAPIEEE